MRFYPAILLGSFILIPFRRHAAASYGHLDILTYLISKGRLGLWVMHRSANHCDKGGDVNVTDEDGETPLYTVENIETAQFLVNHGADPAWKNHEGLTVYQAPSNSYSLLSRFLAGRFS